MPPWYEDEPELFPGDEFYLTAFMRLSTTRQIGMGLGPIPWHHIVHYAELKGLDEENTDAFQDIIAEMDTAYLDWQEQQLKNKSKKPVESKRDG